MKKLIGLLLIPLFLIFLVSCRDKQLDDNFNNVIFYTGMTGSVVETLFDIQDGSTIEEPEEPTKSGFFFKGWYKDFNCTTPWDFESDTVTTSIVLYAKWESAIWDLNFIIDEAAGDVYNDPSATVPTEFTLDKNVFFPIVKRDGWTFKGWILVPPSEFNLSMKLYHQSNHLPYTTREDFTLYAYFTRNTYIIYFSPLMPGVQVPPNKSVQFGLLLSNLVTYDDTDTHTFVGWFTKNGTEDGDWGVQIVSDVTNYMFSYNIRLYGKWEEK